MIDLKNVAPEEAKEVKDVEKEVDKAAIDKAASIDPAIVGTMSDKIELVASIADPSRPDKMMRKNKKTGKQQEHVIGTIVGYSFKALDDIEVPDVNTTLFYKSDLMDFVEEEKNNKRQVKKGETFNLTHFETAKLLSTPEYNGDVLGGKFKAVIAYQKPSGTPKKRPDGRIALPMAYLRAAEKGTSIRDLKQINAIDVERAEVDGKVKIASRKAKAGFEKWAPLAQARAVTPNMIKTQSGLKENVLNFASLLD